MAGPRSPRELADRMRDHRAEQRARDSFVRETFTQPRDDARQTVREFLIATRSWHSTTSSCQVAQGPN